ncbi:MAG: serine/threonine protein kinase [Thiohalomonadales bacterium]
MLGKTIAKKYTITAQVGVGGMGCVYRAKHNVLGRESALKVLHAQLNSDKTFIERFMREARAMARLDHDNIVRIYDVFEENSAHFIAMELFEGPSLKAVIEGHGRLPLEQSVSIISQCARGLAYAHAQGIVHRDIKPSNIMLNSKGRIKITDFGIAAAMDDAATLTNTGQLVGTPRYMSPEQAKNGNIDRRSDLYSLGIVFYELVTGRTPFEGDSGVAIIGKLAYESTELELDFPTNVPDDMRDLIRKMLLRHQEERIQHATHLMAELNKLSTKPENVDSTMTSSLSLVPIEEINSNKADSTVVMSSVAGAKNSNDSRAPQKKSHNDHLDSNSNESFKYSAPEQANKKILPIMGAVAIVVLLASLGLFFINVDQVNDDSDQVASTSDANNSAREKSVQQNFSTLLEIKSAVEVEKNKALAVNAEKIAGKKFGDASDKFLVAESALSAIERNIKNKKYIDAQLSINRAKKVFANASSLYKESIVDATSTLSSDNFEQLASLRKKTLLAGRNINQLRLTSAQKTKHKHATKLSKNASEQYFQAKQNFESGAFTQSSKVRMKQQLSRARSDFSEAANIYANLSDFVQAQDSIDKAYDLRSKLSRIQLRIMSSKVKADEAKASLMAAEDYRKTNSLNGQLSERAMEAKYLLRKKEYRIASIQFEELIVLGNQVIKGYAKSAKVAKEKATYKQTETIAKNRTSAVSKAPTPQSDMVNVEKLLSDFKVAYESRNIELLQSVAELSPNRLEAAKAIFNQYAEIHLSVTSYSLIRGGATANIRIDKVVTAGGDDVVPSQKWRDSKLVLIHDDDVGWRKIVWR